MLPTFLTQHASADVERMVLGNKCDVNDKRQVSKEKGEKVIHLTVKFMKTRWKKLEKYTYSLEEHIHYLSLSCLIVSLFSCCQLALEYGIKFMETSAKANINVENVSSHFY